MQLRIFVVLLASAVVWQQPQLCSGSKKIIFPTDSRTDSSPASDLRGSTSSSYMQITMQETCDGGNNILFDGSCYPEFTKGHPCGDGQWLVRSTLGPASSNGICQKRPCDEHEYLWTIPGNGSQTLVCKDSEYGRRLKCPPNETGFVNEDEGTGECDCVEGSVFWKPTKACYPLFSKGPCKEGEILFYDPEDKFLSCQTNPCDQEGYALWDDNKCYPLRSVQDTPCPGENSIVEYLAINSTTLEVECTAVVYVQFTIVNIPARNCHSSHEAGTSLSRCATPHESYIKIDNGRVSNGCAKGLFRNFMGGCSKWKARKVRASGTLGGGVTTLAMLPTAATEERSSWTGVPTNSIGVGEPTSSQASSLGQGSGVAIAIQQVSPLILVSSAVASSRIMLQ